MQAYADTDTLARLASLELTEEERASFSSELGEIVAFADALADLSEDDVAQNAVILDADDLRADTVEPSLDRACALSVSARQDGEFFIVGGVLTEEDA